MNNNDVKSFNTVNSENELAAPEGNIVEFEIELSVGVVLCLSSCWGERTTCSALIWWHMCN